MPSAIPTRVEFVAAERPQYIAVIAQLARQIWNEHYLSIIGQAQIDYMLDRFQSEATITEQQRSGDEYFLIRLENRDVGYLAVRATPDRQRLFISKLYLLKSERGRGLARRAIEWLAAERCEPVLWLTVNKRNPALGVYQKLGFRVVREVVTDIGNGYVMDDFLLEWHREY
jgi:diamine N-acetyltransferase